MHELISHIARDRAVEHGSGEGIVLMYPVHLGQRRELQWRFDHELSHGYQAQTQDFLIL